MGQEVFLRLKRTGEARAGRYLYTKVGVDISLAGTLGPSSRIDLVEGDPKKPTGRFRGTCAAGSGVIEVRGFRMR